MHIKLIEKLEDIPLSSEQWNSMVANNQTNTIFQTYEWFVSWWRALGKNNQLVLLIAYESNKVIAFAPLMLTNNSYGNKSLSFAGDTNSDYCDFVISGNHMNVISAFLEFINTRITGWNSISFINIPGQSITLSCLQTICLENKNYNIAIKQRVKAPALLLNKHLNQVNSLINKYSVTRHMRKIEKLGKLDFINLSNRAEIISYLDMFFDQHVERYRLKNMTSLFANSENRKLYIDMVKNFEHTDWLLFSVLLQNGKPLAFHFGFKYNNKIIWYKPSFNPRFKKYSPGILMLKHLVEFAIDNSLDELDFTIGNESFKSRFSNCTRYNQNVIIYRSKILCFSLMIIRRASRIIYHTWRRLS